MKLVRSLASKGLVSALPDPDDGRVRGVFITTGGLERFRLAEDNLDAAVEDFLWLLSEEDREELVRLLRRIF
jgi:DNA-binding MarR family transcriptional regulator